MDDAKWLAVIIGALGAIFGVYIRENLRRAFNQKRIATQLEAYLLYWEMGILNSDFGHLVLMAQEWNKERDIAMRSKGKAGFIEVWKKQQAELQDIKTKISMGTPDGKKMLESNHQIMREMSEEVFRATIEDLGNERDALLENRTFISDQDAAELARWAACNVVPLRGDILSLLKQTRMFLLTLRNSEILDYKQCSEIIAKIIEKLIEVLGKMQSLKNGAQRISNRPILILALDNMRFKA